MKTFPKKVAQSDLLTESVTSIYKEDLQKLQEYYNLIKNSDANEIQKLKAELKDLFDLYIESDIAGDNQDRRNKLEAVNQIQKLLSIINNANLSFQVG